MDTVEKNLYQFYQFLGSANQVKHTIDNGYETLRAQQQGWPQILFNLDQSVPAEKLIPQIASDIDIKKYPSVFIAPDTTIRKEHAPLLKVNGIIPFKMLKGMSLEVSSVHPTDSHQDADIIQLEKQKHIDDFTGLVNKELMSGNMITSAELWAELSGKSKGYLRIFGMFRRNSLASTALVFEKENCAGLYFIATGKEFQKKGYASALLKYILNEMNQSSVKNVVLHANNQSFSLYKKLGFTHKNNFILYKKIQ